MSSWTDTLLYAPGTLAIASTAAAVTVGWLAISERQRHTIAAIAILAPVSPLLLVRLALSRMIDGIDWLELRIPGAVARHTAARWLTRGIPSAAEIERRVIDLREYRR